MLSEFRTPNSELFTKERDRLVLWLPVLLGVGCGIYFTLPFEPPATALFPVFTLLILSARWWRRRTASRAVAVALMALALGMLVGQARTRVVAAPVLQESLHFRPLEGRVEDIQDKATGGEKLILNEVTIERLVPEATPKKISVSFRKAVPDLRVGDRIMAKAMMFPPPTPTMPGAYDFARQFYYDRIGAVGFSPSPPVILEHTPASRFEEWLNSLRLSLNARILAPMSPENGPVAAAMMVGEMSAVPKDVGDAMRDAGIYHVLSISGLHMSLAVALMYVSVRLLFSLFPAVALRLPVKKIAAAIGVISAFAYLLVAGYPVPAIRSFVMVACVMIAVICDRRGISLYSLAWSAILVLLFQPEALLGASFQLSYAATIAILAFYERYGHLLHAGESGMLRKLWVYFLGLILTSLVATLATTPLVIYHFNRFTLWGIIANMLMIPLSSFWIMPAVVIAFLAMPFGLERLPLVWLDQGIGWMIAGARWFSHLPYAAFSLPSPTYWGVLMVVFGGLWLCLWQARWRLLGVPLAVLGMATVFLHTPYDLFVSDDASKVAIRREGDDFIFLRGKPTSFDGQSWLRSHGQDKGYTMKDATTDADLPECDKQHCNVTLKNLHIVVGRRSDTEGLCTGTPDMVISSEWLDRIEACKSVRWLIDKAYLRAHGAVAIRIKDGEPRIETVDERRGKRPWNTP